MILAEDFVVSEVFVCTKNCAWFFLSPWGPPVTATHPCCFHLSHLTLLDKLLLCWVSHLVLVYVLAYRGFSLVLLSYQQILSFALEELFGPQGLVICLRLTMKRSEFLETSLILFRPLLPKIWGNQARQCQLSTQELWSLYYSQISRARSQDEAKWPVTLKVPLPT